MNKNIIASVAFLVVGIALIVGEAAGIPALSGWVLRGTKISYGWFAVLFGIGSLAYYWFRKTFT